MFILHTEQLLMHPCSRVIHTSNILPLYIHNLLNLYSTKTKLGSPLSPNAALPLSQQASCGLLCVCDYCCAILCLSLWAVFFMQDDSLAFIPGRELTSN